MPSGYKGKGWNLLLDHAALVEQARGAIERYVQSSTTTATAYLPNDIARSHRTRAEYEAATAVRKRSRTERVIYTIFGNGKDAWRALRNTIEGYIAEMPASIWADSKCLAIASTNKRRTGANAAAHIHRSADVRISKCYSWYNKRKTDYETNNFMHKLVSIDLIISTLRSIAQLRNITRHINHIAGDSQKRYI